MTYADIKNYKLCYVDGNWAWFTSLPLEKQWGDDWNDAPYEHNAGDPYITHKNSDGVYVEHALVKVAWDGNFYPPCEGFTNSYWSVEQINQKDCPWFKTPSWNDSKEDALYAGATLQEFMDYAKRNDGNVFFSIRDMGIHDMEIL